MRHTYQSPHISSPPLPPVGRGDVAAASRLFQDNTEQCFSLSADTFEFKQPIDFSVYIRQRHPGLVSLVFSCAEETIACHFVVIEFL